MMAEATLKGAPYPGYVYAVAPRNVYWETTIACDLACKHCRADAIHQRDALELSTAEACRLIDDIKTMGSMLILTGGDPMKRPDLFEVIAYGREMGVPVSITPSTTPNLTREVVERFRSLGVAALGLSLDGPTTELHDAFRGVPGTFQRAMDALAWADEYGLPVQVNTTVTRDTLPHLPAMFELLSRKPAVRRWSLFLLVPVGRGGGLGIPNATEVERLFEWVYGLGEGGSAPFHVGTVEAPHWRRYWIQRKLATGMPPAALGSLGKRVGLGVRDGNGVIFVSHRGDVFPAGFLPYPKLGNVREQPLSRIYREHPALLALRDMDALTGKCGGCDFRWACGGSRARAFSMTGDPMGSDPFCAFEPAAGVSAATP